MEAQKQSSPKPKFNIGDKVRIDFACVGGFTSYRTGDVVTILGHSVSRLDDGATRVQYVVSGGQVLPEAWLSAVDAAPPTVDVQLIVAAMGSMGGVIANLGSTVDSALSTIADELDAINRRLSGIEKDMGVEA